MELSQHLMEQMEVITQHSKVIAVDTGAENPLLFAYTTMENSSSSTTGSIDFNEFEGINISDFLIRQKIDIRVNNAGFLSGFMEYLKSRTPMRIKLNRNVPYVCFGS